MRARPWSLGRLMLVNIWSLIRRAAAAIGSVNIEHDSSDCDCDCSSEFSPSTSSSLCGEKNSPRNSIDSSLNSSAIEWNK